MRGIGWIALSAALLAGPAAQAQSEMEQYQSGGDGLLAAHRETTQRNIDLATRALTEKDYAKARKYAQVVTRADPKRVEAWLLLGSAQIALQDWPRARITYSTALRLSPGEPEARAGLGVAMARTHDPRAQEQLAWLTASAQSCGARCAQVLKFKGDVETAIAEAAKAP